MGKSDSFRGFRRQLSAVSCVMLIAGAPVQAESQPEPSCSDDTVFLTGDWGSARFSVELADEPQEQAMGLMHRTELPMSAGMYFVNEKPRSTRFWMRNTLLPLDMLFIDAQGIVQHIHANAIPLDETPIFGGSDILTILEINGGLAARLGITVGTRVRHPAHADWSPVWPC